jgi:gamma-glutamyltranspeptidase/glutathione hydrolase
MHKRYGSRPWKKVIEPAIKVAEEGFEAIEEYVKGVKENEKYFRLFPYSAQLMLPDGKIPVVGQKIVFKDLAGTLRKIAEHGPNVYYKGEIRDTIVDFIQKNSGILTKNDFTVAAKEKYLKNMNALNYRGFIILASHYDGSHLHQMLNILSNFDLKKLSYMTPQSIHLLLEAMKIAYIDRYVYTADPDYMAVPMSGMISWVYARDRAREINTSKAKIYKVGDPWAY